MRDQIVDFVRRWSEKTELGAGRFIAWLGIAPSKFYSWRRRYGCVNEHNGWVPRDFWLEEWKKQALLDFYRKHPLEGYRQQERWFKNGQKWRTGSEGRVSVLKRRHGLNRSRYQGDAGMRRWVGLGMIRDNLINIGRVLADSSR